MDPAVSTTALAIGSEVEILIFFLGSVHVNLWGGFRGFILLAFQLNSPRKVKPSINFSFSFAYKYANRRATPQSSFEKFAQLGFL